MERISFDAYLSDRLFMEMPRSDDPKRAEIPFPDQFDLAFVTEVLAAAKEYDKAYGTNLYATIAPQPWLIARWRYMGKGLSKSDASEISRKSIPGGMLGYQEELLQQKEPRYRIGGGGTDSVPGFSIKNRLYPTKTMPPLIVPNLYLDELKTKLKSALLPKAAEKGFTDFDTDTARFQYRGMMTQIAKGRNGPRRPATEEEALIGAKNPNAEEFSQKGEKYTRGGAITINPSSRGMPVPAPVPGERRPMKIRFSKDARVQYWRSEMAAWGMDMDVKNVLDVTNALREVANINIKDIAVYDPTDRRKVLQVHDGPLIDPEVWKSFLEWPGKFVNLIRHAVVKRLSGCTDGSLWPETLNATGEVLAGSAGDASLNVKFSDSLHRIMHTPAIIYTKAAAAATRIGEDWHSVNCRTALTQKLFAPVGPERSQSRSSNDSPESQAEEGEFQDLVGADPRQIVMSIIQMGSEALKQKDPQAWERYELVQKKKRPSADEEADKEKVFATIHKLGVENMAMTRPKTLATIAKYYPAILGNDPDPSLVAKLQAIKTESRISFMDYCAWRR